MARRNSAAPPTLPVFLAFVSVAALARLGAEEAAAAAWVESLGGRCAYDAAGEVAGVDLSNAWLTDDDLGRLARLPGLERITLAYTKITDLGLERLAPLERVRVLDLRYAEAVTDVGIAHLKHWRKLETLQLRGTKVTSSLFEHIAKMATLRSLDVEHTRVNDDLFEELANLPRLERLAFGGNKMSGAALPLLKLLPSLRELSVAGDQRTDSGLWSVAVSDSNVAQIAELGALRALDLGDTDLSDHGVARLAELRELRTLDLSGTGVTGRGLAALAPLPELRHLKLWRARSVGDDAVPHLLAMAKLEKLELPETSLSAAGLAELTQKKGLEQLYLGGLDLAPADVEAARQALPGCLVSWWEKPEIETRPRRRRRGDD
jgi:hypothetical protein